MSFWTRLFGKAPAKWRPGYPTDIAPGKDAPDAAPIDEVARHCDALVDAAADEAVLEVYAPGLRQALASLEVAVRGGAPAPTMALNALAAGLVERVRGRPFAKQLYRTVREPILRHAERLRFVELERQRAPCACACWRRIVGEQRRPLTQAPTDAALVVEERQRDEFGYEEAVRHVCKTCGARWLEDMNLDSDPSFVRWWPMAQP